eukprot:1140092-Pelagomonas_calceolata.AAC.4
MQQALLIGKSGIVASDPGVIHSALLLTERHEPHFIAVIDKLQANKEPAIYKTTQMCDSVACIQGLQGVGLQPETPTDRLLVKHV